MLGAHDGGRAGESNAEANQEDRDGAVEDAFESEEGCERHDKVSFFALDPRGSRGFDQFRPLGEEGLSYLDDA